MWRGRIMGKTDQGGGGGVEKKDCVECLYIGEA